MDHDSRSPFFPWSYLSFPTSFLWINSASARFSGINATLLLDLPSVFSLQPSLLPASLLSNSLPSLPDKYFASSTDLTSPPPPFLFCLFPFFPRGVSFSPLLPMCCRFPRFYSMASSALTRDLHTVWTGSPFLSIFFDSPKLFPPNPPVILLAFWMTVRPNEPSLRTERFIFSPFSSLC